MLYNASFKEWYVESKELSDARSQTTRKLFERIGDVETLTEKDLGNFSIDEFYILLSYLSTHTVTVARDRMTIIEDYMRYFWKNRNVSEDIVDLYMLYFNVQNTSSRCALKLLMFGSSKDMADMFDFALPDISENRVANVLRVMAWLLFMGVSKDDILDIKKSDVDLDKAELNYNGVKYKIDSYAYPVFYQVCTTDYFIVLHRTGVEMRVSSKQPELLIGGNHVRTKNSRQTIVAGIANLNNLIRESGIETSYSADRISTSGEYYRLYLLEKHGGSPIEVIRKGFAERGFTGYILMERTRITNTNYTNWKSTFHGEDE